jgi:hypothetical protein
MHSEIHTISLACLTEDKTAKGMPLGRRCAASRTNRDNEIQKASLAGRVISSVRQGRAS